MSRRFAAVLLAVVAATAILASPATTGVVEAAGPGLSIVTDATYDVQPEAHRVRVTLDMVVKNRLTDTKTRRYYFDHALLGVLPGASAAKLTRSPSTGAKLKIAKSTASSAILRLDFGARLYSGKSGTYRVVFDLVDAGGDAARHVRVGDSLAAFPVWAFASDATPGSTVRVTFPKGYHVSVASGDMPAPVTGADGTVVVKTGTLEKPLALNAYLVADRAGATADRTVEATVGGTAVPLTISAWSDDAPWSQRVGDLASRALPVLSDRIGLAWPRTGGLDIHESIGRASGGYAGLFDPTAGRIDVAYDASDEVVLHEAAHAWFDGSLLADRWAIEGFASYYARAVAPDLGVTTSAGTDAGTIPPALETARIPLNGWGQLGDVARSTEDYGYAASLALARAIGERVGDEGLKAVWADAAASTGAYQPQSGASAGSAATPTETVDGPPDWRGLLDLLDEHATTPLDDLWRTWVARPEDIRLLDARRAARSRYQAVVAAAGDWQLPRALRDAMRAWRFDDANRLLTDAETILDQRTVVANDAAAAGLTLPGTLQAAFEAPDGFTAAATEIDLERQAISRYQSAVAARPAAPDVVSDIGLWGAAPDADLATARTEFAAGDIAGAAASAGRATAAWSTAADVGRGRLVSLAFLVLGAVLVLAIAAAWYRSRRRARHGTMSAGDAGA